MCKINEINKRDNTNKIVSDKWVRKALMVHDTLLVAEDHDGAIFGCTEFDATVAKHCIASKCTPFIGVPVDPIHVVAHTRNEMRTRDDFFEKPCDNPPQLIILHASSAGPVNAKSDSSTNNGVKCVWLSVKDRAAYCTSPNLWLNQFLKLDFDQATLLATVAQSGNRAAASKFENDYSYLLDLILPGRVENLLAFRLLCEAKQAMDRANTERSANGEDVSNTATLGGITIHAPEKPDDWLAPFGKMPDDRNAIGEVAGMIGSGEIKTRAKAVLDAVNDNGGKLDDAIDHFLKEVAEPNS